MANVQCSFERVEKKFLLTQLQAKALLHDLRTYMEIDQYGQHTIRNLYFDTPDYAVIRRSVLKPVYKVKFRLRAYGTPAHDTLVFAELKKKYKGIVYKRRIAAAPEELSRFLQGEMLPDEPNVQIQRELHRYLQEHPVAPRVLLSYERIALFGREDPALRVTFDTNLRFRTDRLEQFTDDSGRLICDDNPVVLEIKLAHAAPLWLTHLLSRHHCYMTSFSKYGTCYLKHLACNVPDIRTMIPCENNKGANEYVS